MSSAISTPQPTGTSRNRCRPTASRSLASARVSTVACGQSGATGQAGNTVVVNYKGWLEDESSPFDQSYGRGPFPVDLVPIGQQAGVIDGWNEGLTYVGEGGMIELEIPSDLAYGADGRPPVIPPSATLHFVVEVLEVR